MDNPNIPNVLIKLSSDDDFFAVSTYCRRHGRRGRFLILRDRMKQILRGNTGTLYDSDCGNHVSIHIMITGSTSPSIGSPNTRMEP